MQSVFKQIKVLTFNNFTVYNGYICPKLQDIEFFKKTFLDLGFGMF